MSIKETLITSDCVEFFRSVITTHKGPDILADEYTVIPQQLTMALGNAIATGSAVYSPSFSHELITQLKLVGKSKTLGRCSLTRVGKESNRPYHYQLLITFIDEHQRSDVYIIKIRSNLASKPDVVERLDREAREAAIINNKLHTDKI